MTLERSDIDDATNVVKTADVPGSIEKALHLPYRPVRLILRCHLSPGDIVVLTATIRDLHRAYPGRFLTDLRTTAADLWENNPYRTPLSELERDVRVIDMHYDLIHQSNRRPYHFLHGFAQHLEQQLGLPIPLTEFKGDIYLSNLEKSWISQVEETGYKGDFWLMVAGGKYDFTAKWWNPNSYQRVVDHFRGKIQFVQVGEASHWHPQLQHVINLVGKTNIRQFVRLMFHSVGVVCPVTFAMHLAAAVECKFGRPRNRACVVVAGGREPTHWEAYPFHRYLSTTGALPCCDHGGCWKSQCQPAPGAPNMNSSLCEHPVELTPNLRIPKCMNIISAEDVIRAIELYYEGGALQYAFAREEHDTEVSSNQ